MLSKRLQNSGFNQAQLLRNCLRLGGVLSLPIIAMGYSEGQLVPSDLIAFGLSLLSITIINLKKTTPACGEEVQ